MGRKKRVTWNGRLKIASPAMTRHTMNMTRENLLSSRLNRGFSKREVDYPSLFLAKGSGQNCTVTADSMPASAGSAAFPTAVKGYKIEGELFGVAFQQRLLVVLDEDHRPAALARSAGSPGSVFNASSSEKLRNSSVAFLCDQVPLHKSKSYIGRKRRPCSATKCTASITKFASGARRSS